MANNRFERILGFFDLHQGEDDQRKVLENVMSSVSFRGSNLWILACAIVIASVGLNVNSPAVVIGAMLISPLMGPIVGAGFSLGIFDFQLLRKSLKNLLIATLVGLIVSTLYFLITPFKDPQSEIIARTAPNIYDVIIAFFGGLVGVIAITRVEKGNPIPGVAIATALMPPLCTAGFGLATGNLRFFFGAIYLYSINCVFICIATFAIVKYLRYPVMQLVDSRRQRQIRHVMTVLILIMILPSLYFAYALFEEKKFNEQVDHFVSRNFIENGYTIIYRKTRFASNPKNVELAFLNKRFTAAEMDSLQDLFTKSIQNTRLVIRQDTADLKKDILNELGADRARLAEKDKVISGLRQQLAGNQLNSGPLLEEIKLLFPAITDIAISNHRYTASNEARTIAMYRGKKALPDTELKRLRGWLARRLNIPNLEVMYDDVATP